MKIKKNDVVQIIAGKDRGKIGKVLRVFGDLNKIIVENINLYKKHMRAKKTGQKGEVVTLPRPINASNALSYCSGCGRGTRVGMNLEGEKKIRICRKCKKAI